MPVSARINVPKSLVASHTRYFGAAGRLWIAALPDLAAQCLDRWRLRADGPPVCGDVALVLPVLRGDGTAAALKLQPVDDETGAEPVALRMWDGQGAVRLLEHDPDSGSMLLERLDADRSLHTFPDDAAALRILSELLARLSAHPAPDGMRRLADIAPALVEATPHALTLLADPAERRLLERCAAVVRELLADTGDRLLHWDLHYGNVLATLQPHRDEPWSAIDPKPLAGDPGFELLPALWNRWDDVVATGNVPRAVRRRFDLMTGTAGLPRQRARGWTLGRVLQTAITDVERLGQTRIFPIHRAIAHTLLGDD